MARILVLYDSVYGQTKKISEYIASEIKKRNHIVQAIDVSNVPENILPENFDGIILGGPVHAGKFPSHLTKWATRHARVLNAKPSAFFSVCLGILQKEEAVQKEERDIVLRFFKQTGWTARQWDIFAGSLVYTKYNFFIRWVMKRITKKAGGATDTSLDYEYTDWAQVSRFADGFCQTVTISAKEMTDWHI